MRAMVLLLGTILGVGAILFGLKMGSDPVEGLQLASRYTARAALPLFLFAFTASSLARLWPSHMTKRIFQVRRWWGLSFALCHTLHLVAFVTYFKALGEPVPLIGAPFYVLMYALVLTSTNAAQKRMGRNWKHLHKTGVYALWLAFTFAYTAKVVTGEELIMTIPLAALCYLALGLRFASWRAKRAKAAMA